MSHKREVSVAPFGSDADGVPVHVFSLTNANGVELRLTNYGGIVLSVRVPDRNGHFEDVVLGFDTLDAYKANDPYFGALVGRYANRIAGGRFTLDGVDYTLALNDGDNHLHGGHVGFDKVVWGASPFVGNTYSGVRLSHVSPDGAEGYPGNLSVVVTYTLNDDNEFRVDYEATTDRATPINLTQHSYFNLGGGPDILGHEMMLNASRMTPIDSGLIPTGEIVAVEGTPFDFRKPATIGSRIHEVSDDQIRFGLGYDHNFVIDRDADPSQHLVLAATVSDPESGRRVDVLTTEPGIQFYSGNFLDGTHVGKQGTVYGHRSGFCLETQHFPDSPNHHSFPDAILAAGETFESSTIFRFGIQ